MASLNTASDAGHWFLEEIGARVVAESGVPTDRFHLGKLVLRSLKDAPEFVMQIDAATGQSETYASVLERTVRCAACFQKMGLKVGDVIVMMAPSHIDLAIPFYAALYLGIAIAALDANLGAMELETMFKINQGKLIFCQNERVPVIKEALRNIKLNSTIVTFNDSNDCINFKTFMEEYGQEANVENFKGAEFDPAETIAMLVSTSGTTGLPKSASITHKHFVLSIIYLWKGFSQFPTPTRLALIASPLHWLSAGFHFLLSPILRYTRLQSSAALTQEHFIELVQTYRPSYTTVSPTLLRVLIKPDNRGILDISCFDTILIGGSTVSRELIDEVWEISPKTHLQGLYGLSEIGGLAFFDDHPAPGSVGRPIGLFDYRLTNIETREEITMPHTSGELWLKGPCVSKGYYNNPEATADAFEEGGWFRTGDIFYRDENYYFYFVDRLKSLLKYKNHQISPVELEGVIRQHSGVLDVAVTAVPDPECGDLPVACVVPRPGLQPTAQEIKSLVKDSLTDSKQLRGGVIFMNELPLTTSTKINRRKLKEIVLTLKRE